MKHPSRSIILQEMNQVSIDLINRRTVYQVYYQNSSISSVLPSKHHGVIPAISNTKLSPKASNPRKLKGDSSKHP